MNYNKTTKKAVKVEVAPVRPRPIVITNHTDKSGLISGANLGSAELTKAHKFFRLNGQSLPLGMDFASLLKQDLGDVHYEKVGMAASIRLGGEKRIEFTQSDVAAVIGGEPMQLAIYVTHVGSPTYGH